ncbi:OLC1v1008084C1 [Oldenlandia corymbosa var. corymbosa]|uniref:OLC1v1008084C1 n=1 Tax=Oldenlandia corymbosa var. corymbosa TaxID=529605 RepID=A0AAV1DKZ4_OLDCO|nr:OLC1v1008084C1 [Oldenlandia corymbosa var. corymbosa]
MMPAIPPERSISMFGKKDPMPKHISLRQQINEDEKLSALMTAIMEAVPNLKTEHRVRISDAAVCWATYLTHHHFSGTPSGDELERMAMDILNSGCLLLKSEINSRADEKRLGELEYVFTRYIVESTELLRENPEDPWLVRVTREADEARTVLTELASLPAEIEEIYEKSQGHEEVLAVDRRHIGQVVSWLIGIPLPLLPTYGSTQLSCLASRLSERFVCQDGAIEDMNKSIFTNALLHPDRKKCPRASLLFLGPSGVGKTGIAKSIAEVFFGSQDSLICVDMSQFGELRLQQEHSGFQSIAETIRENPYRLILFEKIGKSNLDAMRTFLLDLISGKLSDKDGHHANLTNVIVIITFDVRAKRLRRQVKSFEGVPAKTSAKDRAVEEDKGAKAIESWLDENVMPQLNVVVKKMANKHGVPCAVYIDTMIGTEKLSFRLDETDLIEEWMNRHFRLSFRNCRSLYQMRNGTLELRNCLSSLPDLTDYSHFQSQKLLLDKALHAIEICNRINKAVEDSNKQIQKLDEKCFKSELVYKLDGIMLLNPSEQAQINTLSIPLKEDGVLPKPDRRKTGKLIYSLFRGNAGSTEGSDLCKFEESSVRNNKSGKSGRVLIKRLFSKLF